MSEGYAGRRIEILARDRARFGAGIVAELPAVIAELARRCSVRRHRRRGRPIGRRRPGPRPAPIGAASPSTCSTASSRTRGPSRSSAEARCFGGSALHGDASWSSPSAAARRWTPRRRSRSTRPTACGPGTWLRRRDARARAPGHRDPDDRRHRRRDNTYGVITDEAVGRKGYIGHDACCRRSAILDPELTVGLPPGPTAATGVDAMTHSLESLLSAQPEPVRRGDGARRHPDGRRVAAAGRRRRRGPRGARRMLLAVALAGVGQASGTGVGARPRARPRARDARPAAARDGPRRGACPRSSRFYLERLRDRELRSSAVALGAPTHRPSSGDRCAARRSRPSGGSSRASASGRPWPARLGFDDAATRSSPGRDRRCGDPQLPAASVARGGSRDPRRRRRLTGTRSSGRPTRSSAAIGSTPIVRRSRTREDTRSRPRISGA